MAMKGYCVRCKDKAGREMKNMRVVDMRGKGGVTRKAATGECAVCGTKMYKILPKDFKQE